MRVLWRGECGHCESKLNCVQVITYRRRGGGGGVKRDRRGGERVEEGA